MLKDMNMNRFRDLLWLAAVLVLIIFGATAYLLHRGRPMVPVVQGGSEHRAPIADPLNDASLSQRGTAEMKNPVLAAPVEPQHPVSVPPVLPQQASRLPQATVHAISHHYSGMIPNYQDAKGALEKYRNETPELYKVVDSKIQELSSAFRILAFAKALNDPGSAHVYQVMLNNQEFFEFVRNYMDTRVRAKDLSVDVASANNAAELASAMRLAAQQFQPKYDRQVALFDITPEWKHHIETYSSHALLGQFIQKYMGDHGFQYAPPVKRFLTTEETAALKAALRKQ